MIRFFASLLFTIALMNGSAAAHERLALVIGNAGYVNIQELDNPVNDARLIRDTLQGAGFDVTMLTDVDRTDMMQAVEVFAKKVKAAGTDSLAVFYYAGHGVRSDDFNYLLPLNVNIQLEADLTREAVSAEWVLDRIHLPEAISVVILDACRDNPFDTSQSDVILDLGDGLARMAARRNNVIAYATGPGDVALDGSSDNSPYTASLVRAIQTPGLSIENMFEQVRVDVAATTGGLQVPWARSSMDSRIGIKNHSLLKR